MDEVYKEVFIDSVMFSNHTISLSLFVFVISIIIFYHWWPCSKRLVNPSPLLPPCPKHKIQNRNKVVETIHLKFSELCDRCPDHDTVMTVYLEGPPGFGKTQVARLFAKEFYHIHAQRCKMVVGTLNASTRIELLDSYVQLAGHLGIKIDINQISADERLSRGLQLVSNSVQNVLKSKDKWLLIVDNLTSEIKQMECDGINRISSSYILPQSGDNTWGHGYVLVTTKEGSLVEKGGSLFSTYYYLDHGFSEEEGTELLSSICGINDNHELSDAKKLIKNLEGIPLSIAAAGCYVAKEQSHNRKYSFINYIKDLDKTHRDFAEKQTKQVNNYPWTLTTALVMCILQQEALHKVFCFLSSCAHAPMPMRLIARLLGEHLDVVTSAIQEVRDSVLLQISFWTTADDEDPIEIIEMHEITWSVMRNIYIENLDANQVHEMGGQQQPTIAQLNSLEVLDWFSLGLKLGISDYELKTIECDYPKDSKACKRTMFSKWLEVDINASYKKLIFSLEEISLVKVANDLRRKYGPSKDCITFIYSWSEIKKLLCEFAECLFAETSDMDGVTTSHSPLYEFQHRLLPHMESIITIKDFNTVFSADWQFRLYYCTGQQYLATAQRQKAKVLLEDSLRVIENCSDEVKNSLEYQNAKLYLGVVYSHLGKLDIALNLYKELLTILPNMYGEDSPNVARALRLIGGSLTPHKKYNQSEKHLNKALSIMEKVYGPQHPEVGAVLISLGENMINDSQKIKNSVITLNRAVTIFESLQKYKKKLAFALAMLGTAYCYANQPKEAVHTFWRCLHIFQKVYGEDNVYNGVAFTGLSVSLHLMGCIVKSKEYLVKAIKIFDTYPDMSHYRVAALRYQHLAATCCIQGDFTKASFLLAKASHIIDEIKDKNLCLYNGFLTSCNYILNGNFKEAIRIIEIPQELFEKTHSVILSTLYIVCLEKGDVSVFFAIQNVLKSRPKLKELISSILGVLSCPTQPYKIPSIHILVTLVNTYLSRNHISWPAFKDALKGMILLQANKHSNAEWYLQSAIHQYEKMFSQGSLLTIEAKFFLATCVLHSNVERALNILEKAQSELKSLPCSCHPLSAKLSYLTAFIYQRLENKESAQCHIISTLDKIQSYCDKAHPWLAELYFQLITLSSSNEQKLKQYKTMCRNMYEQLIEQESAQSKQFKVEDETEKILKSWKDQLMSII